MNISHEQLAELLVGIAKAQAALTSPHSNEVIGLKIIPALTPRNNRATLADLPRRLLMSIVAGGGDFAKALELARKELPRLLP